MSRASAYLATVFTLIGDRFADRKDRGATAVEYGLLVGLIAVGIIAVLVFLGPQLSGLFQSVSDSLTGAGFATPAPTTAP